MTNWLQEWWQEIVARPDGPFAMRFYLQPAMAAFFAIRDGLKDSRAGKPAYFWDLFSSDKSSRRKLIRHGWKSVGKVFVIATILDVVYQLIVLRAIHPLQALLVATMLAIVPYIIFRGPINRLAKAATNRKSPRKAA